MLHEHPASLTTRPWNMLSMKTIRLPFFSVSAYFFVSGRTVKRPTTSTRRPPGCVDWANPSGAKVAGPGPVEQQGFKIQNATFFVSLVVEPTRLKNISEIGSSSPSSRGENIKYLKPPPSFCSIPWTCMRILISWIKLQVVFCRHICVLLSANYSRRYGGVHPSIHKNQTTGLLLHSFFTSDVGIQRRIELDGDWWGMMMKKYCNGKQKLIQRKL